MNSTNKNPVKIASRYNLKIAVRAFKCERRKRIKKKKKKAKSAFSASRWWHSEV
jgi:hypothetical protein